MELKTATARAKAKLCSQRTVIEGCLVRNNLVEPDNSYGREKYGTVIAFPMADEETFNSVKRSMKAAFERKREKLTENGVEPNFEKDVILPFREDSDFEDFCFLRATNTQKPTIVDTKKKPLNLTAEPVWGARGKISVLFKCAKIDNKIRIFGTLQNVQLISDKNYLEASYSFSPDEDFEEITLEDSE